MIIACFIKKNAQILLFQLLKSEYSLVSLVLPDSKLHIFEL